MVLRLFISAAVFAAIFMLTLRFVFPSVLDAVLERLPRGRLIRRWLGLGGT